MGNQVYLGIWDTDIGTYYAEWMRIKSQALDTFSKFICQAECQSDKKLKHLRTDFGKKFANCIFEEYKSKEGVKLKMSAPYTPEQNEKAERLNYTLMSSIWTILAAIHFHSML